MPYCEIPGLNPTRSNYFGYTKFVSSLPRPSGWYEPWTLSDSIKREFGLKVLNQTLFDPGEQFTSEYLPIQHCFVLKPLVDYCKAQGVKATTGLEQAPSSIKRLLHIPKLLPEILHFLKFQNEQLKNGEA